MTQPGPSFVPNEETQAPKSDAGETFTTASPASVRDKLGVSTAEMAGLLGMSEFGYRMWEQGTRRPGGPAFKLLALIDAQPSDMLSRLREQSSER